MLFHNRPLVVEAALVPQCLVAPGQVWKSIQLSQQFQFNRGANAFTTPAAIIVLAIVNGADAQKCLGQVFIPGQNLFDLLGARHFAAIVNDRADIIGKQLVREGDVP